MTTRNHQNSRYNIPTSTHAGDLTEREVRRILDEGILEAGIENETTPSAEIYDLGVELDRARHAALKKAA